MCSLGEYAFLVGYGVVLQDSCKQYAVLFREARTARSSLVCSLLATSHSFHLRGEGLTSLVNNDESVSDFSHRT